MTTTAAVATSAESLQPETAADSSTLHDDKPQEQPTDSCEY